MTLAITDTDQLESSDVWFAINVTAWCSRMAAKLSAAACEQHRNNPLNGRCFRCGGLEDQTPQNQELPELNINVDGDRLVGFEALDEIIDGLYEYPAPGDDFYDVELDVDEEQLLALFPEFAEVDDEKADTETNFPRFSEWQKAAKRRAVYKGRCKRCSGYMENTREFQDENVFHCLACGWRTGPEYESNRAIEGGHRG